MARSANLVNGTITSIVGTPSSTQEFTLTTSAQLPTETPFGIVIWPKTKATPRQGEAEICIVEARTGGVVTKCARNTGTNSVSRALESGDFFAVIRTAETEQELWEKVEKLEARFNVGSSVTGEVFVATNGNNANDGLSWYTAKKTAGGTNGAVNALPTGPEGGKVGKVRYGHGTFEENSEGRVAEATWLGEKCQFVEVPSATNADVGANITSFENFGPESCRIGAVLTGTREGAPGSYFINTGVGTKKYIELVRVELSATGFVKQEAGATGADKLYIWHPACEAPTGVIFEGKGRLSGYHGGTSIEHGTLVKDNGTGFTYRGESGTGESNTPGNQTLAGGGHFRDMTIEGNQENLGAIEEACNYGLSFENVTIQNHGWRGANLGEQSVVMLNIDDTEFRGNGIQAQTYVEGQKYNKGERASEKVGGVGLVYECMVASSKGKVPSANTGTGEWRLCKYPVKQSGGFFCLNAPNSGAIKMLRCFGNYGNGARLCGVKTDWLTCSRTEFNEGENAGWGLISEGIDGNGIVSIDGGWFENNAVGAIKGSGVFKCVQFQGHAREKFAVQCGKTLTVLIGCCSFNHTEKVFVEEGPNEAKVTMIGCTTSGTVDTIALRRHKAENPNFTFAEAEGFVHT